MFIVHLFEMRSCCWRKSRTDELQTDGLVGGTSLHYSNEVKLKSR